MTKLNRHIIIPLGIAGIGIVIFWMVSLTLNIVIAFIPGLVLTYILYLNTFYKKVSESEKILPLYLLALGIQFLHFTEEYLTGFTEVVPELLGQQPYPVDYWLVFNMIAYTVFIAGGIILFKHIRPLMIIPLFFILVGVVLNSAAHIFLALYVGGYFSGLYTALAYVVIGPVLLKRVFAITKADQESDMI